MFYLARSIYYTGSRLEENYYVLCKEVPRFCHDGSVSNELFSFCPKDFHEHTPFNLKPGSYFQLNVSRVGVPKIGTVAGQGFWVSRDANGYYQDQHLNLTLKKPEFTSDGRVKSVDVRIADNTDIFRFLIYFGVTEVEKGHAMFVAVDDDVRSKVFGPIEKLWLQPSPPEDEEEEDSDDDDTDDEDEDDDE